MRLSLILLFLQLWGNMDVSLSQDECSTLPDVPHSYVSEDTKQSQYKPGHVLHFTCETGYISGPVIRYVCTSGGWLAVHRGSCYLKPCELPDETPNGYYHIIHGEEFVFGTTIKYFCNEGYQMVSRDDTRTCYLDKWSNHVPICRPFSCDHPPADGRMTVTGLPDNDNPILPDRFLTFSCDNPGQYLNGSSRLICGKDGKWDNPFPSCEEITCSVDVTHPHLKVVGLLAANKTIQTGHKVQFLCEDEYLLNGSEESECLETGQWSDPFPTCIDKCLVTGLPASVRLETHIEGARLKTGETLRFYCHLRGHHLQGTSEVHCLPNGKWSHPFPTCASLDCGRPPFLADGDTKTVARPNYRNNERVEYVCQNYYVMEGNPYKTCINGKWTGEMRCLKPCTVNEELMRTHNIAFRFSPKHKLYSEHNDVIEFMCSSGRRHDGRVALRQYCINGEMALPTCV